MGKFFVSQTGYLERRPNPVLAAYFGVYWENTKTAQDVATAKLKFESILFGF